MMRFKLISPAFVTPIYSNHEITWSNVEESMVPCGTFPPIGDHQDSDGYGDQGITAGDSITFLWFS